MNRRHLALVLVLSVKSAVLGAQEPRADASDVATPAAIVRAAYAAVSRAPGQPFQWARFRALYLPGAQLIPNTEQTGGRFTPHSMESFVAWIDSVWRQVGIGGPNDKGFEEGQVVAVTEQYGDIAHVLSTYEKHLWGDPRVVGRGINSFQLVRRDGRWWIAGLIWDEETGAGPVPPKYLPGGSDNVR